MKKLTFALTLAATLFGSSGFAQPASSNKNMPARPPANDHFAWGPALGTIALLGVVVGIVAGTAASSADSYSH